MIRAITYTRFSTPEQIEGNSQDRQDEDIRRFASEHGLTIDAKFTFKDVGVSGHHGEHRKRGALGDFLQAVDEGLVRQGEWLLIEDFDRLSREEPLEALDLFSKLIRSGITIATVSDRQVYDRQRLKRDQSCLYVVLGKMIRAHDESEMKSQRVHRAWRQNQLKTADKRLLTTGKWSIPWWLKVRDGKFAPVPALVAVVNDIFRMTANGMGRHAIVKELTRRGVKAPRGGAWNPSTIGQLLMRDQVLGFYQPHSRLGGAKRHKVAQPIANYYPVVLPPALVAEARAAIAARRTGAASGPKGAAFNNLFVGIVFCVCGAPMWLHDRGKRGGRELICSAHYAGRGKCERTGFNYERFEEQFRDHVLEVDLSRLERGKDKEHARLRDEIAALEIEQQQKREEMRRLAESIRLARLDRPPEMVMQMIAQLESDVAQLAAQQRDKQTELESRLARPAKASLTAMKRVWPKDDYETRAALSAEIRKVVEKIVFDGSTGNVGVHLVGDVGYFIIDHGVLARYQRSQGVVHVKAEAGGRAIEMLATPPDIDAPGDWSPLDEDDVADAISFIAELAEAGVDVAGLTAKQLVKLGGPDAWGEQWFDANIAQVALNRVRARGKVKSAGAR